MRQRAKWGCGYVLTERAQPSKVRQRPHKWCVLPARPRRSTLTGSTGMSSYLRPVYGARSDAGRQREHNEDFLYAGQLPPAPAGFSPWYVFAVADGVGGHHRGEWASQTAVNVLREEIAGRIGVAAAPDALRDAFLVANKSVWESDIAG